MKKNWLKIITLFVVPLFVISGVIFCCLENTAEAEEQSVPSCHQTSESQQGNEAGAQSSAEDCDCAHMANLPTVPAVKSVASIFPDVKNILPLNSIAENVFSDAIFILAHQGPPQPAAHSIPIYIQNSNLQL